MKETSFGDHSIIGLEGPSLTDNDKRILSALRPAGILLLARNFRHGSSYDEWLDALRALLSDVREYTGRTEIFVTIDHEGGNVVRTPPPLTRFPYPCQYANRAKEVASCMAVELRSIGCNVSWAPLADIHSNPKNPIIGPRAFGSSPDFVSRAAEAFLEGLQQGGLLGCAKHFPGHGDTASDSHLELPILELGEAELRARELVPFGALVRAKVPFVMTAHILFPALDSSSPATLSPRVLQTFLREEMGYEGVIVSDDLDMAAVATSFDDPSTLPQAFRSGCDMFIIARQPWMPLDRPLTLARTFSEALKNGMLDEETVDRARTRVISLLQRTPQYDVTPLPDETFRRHFEVSLSVALGRD